MIKKEDVLKIKMYPTYKEFCDNQENCIECEIAKNGLIYDKYDQPCEEIYQLLVIIHKLAKLAK